MPPVTIIALGAIIGIAIGPVINLSQILVLIIFILSVILSLAFGKNASTAYRMLMAFVVFVLLGLFLSSIAQIDRDPVRARTHTNPIYRSIADSCGRALNEKDCGIALAIVFGDQDAVESAEKDNFKRAGLLHLFAASGFNVALAAGFIMVLAHLAGAPKLGAASIAIATIFFYLWLIGPSPSVLRAVVMSVILYLSFFFGRKVDGLASTSFAALILLTINPNSLFDIGWQLSFASLLGILLVAPKISALFKPEISKLASPLSITLGAQVMVAPFLIYYFGQISTVAVLANPFASIIVAYVTGIGFISGLVSLIWPALGQLGFSTLSPLLRLISQMSSFFANIPGSMLETKASLGMALGFIVVTILVFLLTKSMKGKLTFPAIIIFVLCVQASGVWFNLGQGFQREGLAVHFLDIGQGDATIIKSKSGSVILIDSGKEFSLLQRELRQRGVRRIDLLILSHAHADHLGAIAELINVYPVDKVIEPGFPYDTRGYKEFKETLKKNGIERHIGRAGQRFKVGDVLVKILWPRPQMMRGTNSDVNNNSIVAKIEYKDFQLLMPGDIEEEAIETLTSGSVDLRAQVLKVSHQGSSNGTTTRFLNRIKPEYAVISVGRNNPYGHPHAVTIRRLKRFVSDLGRTDYDGDVYVGTDGSRIRFASDK